MKNEVFGPFVRISLYGGSVCVEKRGELEGERSDSFKLRGASKIWGYFLCLSFHVMKL